MDGVVLAILEATGLSGGFAGGEAGRADARRASVSRIGWLRAAQLAGQPKSNGRRWMLLISGPPIAAGWRPSN